MSNGRGLPVPVHLGIQAWAKRTPKVQRVWLFGSRARGTHRLDSDIDLAIEIVGWDALDDGRERVSALAAWVNMAGEWQAELQRLTALVIDLDRTSLEDDVVLPAVKKHGVVLWSAG